MDREGSIPDRDESALERDELTAWLRDKIVSSNPGLDASSGRAREAILPDRDEVYLRLQSVRIFVSDLERSMRFFVDQLGFRLLEDVRFASGKRWIEVAPSDGTASLSLFLPDPGSGEEALIGRPTQISFLTEDVEAKFREWSGRGVRFTMSLQRPEWGAFFLPFRGPRRERFLAVGL